MNDEQQQIEALETRLRDVGHEHPSVARTLRVNRPVSESLQGVTAPYFLPDTPQFLSTRRCWTSPSLDIKDWPVANGFLTVSVVRDRRLNDGTHPDGILPLIIDVALEAASNSPWVTIDRLTTGPNAQLLGGPLVYYPMQRAVSFYLSSAEVAGPELRLGVSVGEITETPGAQEPQATRVVDLEIEGVLVGGYRY